MLSDRYVEFDKVEKSYDGRHAVVESLDLAIAKGEFLTLLGPSGSGKTTTLMMLAGFEAPSSGEIRLAGRSIGNVPPHRRNIGMVFQNYALFPHLTVAENLAYPLRVRRLGKQEISRRVAQALDMIQMGTYADRKPAQLSGGQQQRIALARALVFDPDLVLMDEPLGALDKNLREHLQFEIKQLHQRIGVTVVYVTHDQSEALTMSDRIAVFNAGRVEQLSTPRMLYEQPRTGFVAGFIGENNKLIGIISRRQHDECQVEIDGGVSILARCDPAHEWLQGEEVTVSIRPENVHVGPQTETPNNDISACVSEVIYLGDHIRLHLNMPAGDVLVAKLPAQRGTDYRAGDTLRIGWNAADGVVLPPEKVGAGGRVMARPNPERMNRNGG